MVVVNSPTLVDNNDYCLLNSSTYGGVNSSNLHNTNNNIINNANNSAQNSSIYNVSLQQTRPQQQQSLATTNSSGHVNYYAGVYARHEFIDLPVHQQTYLQTLMPLSSSGSLAAAALHNQPHHHTTTADYSYPPPPATATLNHQQQRGSQSHLQHQQQYGAGFAAPQFYDNGQQAAFSGGGTNLINAADVSGLNTTTFPAAAVFTAATGNVHHPSASFVPVHPNTATLIVSGGAPAVGTAVNINFHQNHSTPHMIGDLYQKHNGITANTVVYSSTAVYDSLDAGSGGGGGTKDRSLPTSAASDTTTSSNNSSTSSGGDCKVSGGKSLKNKQRKSNPATTTAASNQQQQQQRAASTAVLINNSPSTSKSADSANDAADGSSGYLVESIDSGLAADNSSPEHHARCSSVGVPTGVNYLAVAPPIYGGVGSADGSYGMSTNHASSVGGSNRNQDSSGSGRNRTGVTNIVGQPVGNGPSGSGCGGGGGGSNGDSRTSSPPALVDNTGAGAPAIGPHAVYVHVNPGETLSVRVGNDIQHIPGTYKCFFNTYIIYLFSTVIIIIIIIDSQK